MINHVFTSFPPFKYIVFLYIHTHTYFIEPFSGTIILSEIYNKNNYSSKSYQSKVKRYKYAQLNVIKTKTKLFMIIIFVLVLVYESFCNTYVVVIHKSLVVVVIHEGKFIS